MCIGTNILSDNIGGMVANTNIGNAVGYDFVVGQNTRYAKGLDLFPLVRHLDLVADGGTEYASPAGQNIRCAKDLGLFLLVRYLDLVTGGWTELEPMYDSRVRRRGQVKRSRQQKSK